MKNYNWWVGEESINNKRENRAYDAKVTYFNKSFGQKIVEYIGPT